MSVRRKIEDEKDAARCLRAAERKGLSAGDWARAHGGAFPRLRVERVELPEAKTQHPELLPRLGEERLCLDDISPSG